MQKLLSSPIDAGKVRLANIELLERKTRIKEKVEDKMVVKNVFMRTWKFYVENRRTKNINVSFHFTLLNRDGTEAQKDEFVIPQIESFTAVGNVYYAPGQDLKILLESMRIEEFEQDTEIVPLDIDLGYTGYYSKIEKTGMKIGKMFGKVSQKAVDYFKENNSQ